MFLNDFDSTKKDQIDHTCSKANVVVINQENALNLPQPQVNIYATRLNECLNCILNLVWY